MTKNGRIGTAKHFYWYEAIKPNDIFPNDSEIIENIVDTASQLEQYRTYLGNRAIIITSWYRNPQRNKRVKGAKNSRHLYGDAVDFYCLHLSTFQIYELLDKYHGDKGGLGLYKQHVHIDFRGHRARWKKAL